MRVLEVLPALEKGGVENFVLMLSPQLEKLGADVFVCSSGGPLVKRLEKDNIKHITFDVKSKNPYNFLKIPKLRKILKKYNIDIVHVHSRVPAWLFYFACHGICPIVMSPHGQYNNHAGSYIVKRIPFLIVGAEFLRDYFHEIFKIDMEKIFLAPYGIDTLAFTKEDKNKSNNKFIFGAAGRFTKLKGFDILLKAFSKLIDEDIELRIAGSGEEGDSLKALTKSLNLQKKVKFLGQIDDMKGFYNSIDMLIISSLREGLPLTLLESMSCETPAIATKVGDIPLVIKDGENGFLFKDINTFSMIDGLKRVLKNKDDITFISKKSRKTILEKHDFHENAKIIFDLYKKLM